MFRFLTALSLGFLTFAGCVPSPPAYLNDNGNLNFYLEQATQVEYPDVQTVPLDEVMLQRAPITITDANFDSFWDLCLEDAVAIALQNTKVIRGFGTPGLTSGRVAPGADSIVGSGSNATTLYNVAIRESEPGFIGTPGQIATPGSLSTNGGLEVNQGVEAALAAFDAQLTSNLSWGKTDIPRNVFDDPRNQLRQITPAVFVQDQVSWQTEIAKQTAVGTQLFFRTVNSFTENNIPSTVQPLERFFQSALEAEVRQPLLRGRGAFVNRMPIMISRIQTDQEIANLEAIIQNKVTNVEIRYWDLQCAYRFLETAKTGRDAALDTWRMVEQNFKAGKVALQDETEAREQYYFFRAQVETAFASLLDAESDLRWVMGVAITDGRLARPIEEPIKAWVAFDWCESLDEALSYRPELRQERWEIRKKELQVAYSKNGLLPTLNATGLYRWQGLGEKMASYGNNVGNFPSDDSGALNDLFGGDYQEFSVGLNFGLSVGFRRELANVRNAQLKLAEQIAILEDMELDVSRELSQALRALDTQYELVQTNFNRWVASTAEVEARIIRLEAGSDPISFTLDAQRRRSQGEQAYYQALCEYNKMISLIHRRKGTILAYNSIHFSEGPWSDKAYHDASENARRRSASRHMDYGWTRPEVISQGSYSATARDACPDGNCYGGEFGQPMQYDSAQPIPSTEYGPGAIIEGDSGNGTFYGDGQIINEGSQGVPFPNVEQLPQPNVTPPNSTTPTDGETRNRMPPRGRRTSAQPNRNGATALLSDQNGPTQPSASNAVPRSVLSNSGLRDGQNTTGTVAGTQIISDQPGQQSSQVLPAIRDAFRNAQRTTIRQVDYHEQQQPLR